MRQLSPAGEQTINGNGSMAQFSHPEFSGSGQWMRGGMIMVSDIFATIEKLSDLCSKGVRSNSEYETKKAELLSRL